MRDLEKEERFASQYCDLSERSVNFIIEMITLSPERFGKLRGFIYHPDRIELVFEDSDLGRH